MEKDSIQNVGKFAKHQIYYYCWVYKTTDSIQKVGKCTKRRDQYTKRRQYTNRHVQNVVVYKTLGTKRRVYITSGVHYVAIPYIHP